MPSPDRGRCSRITEPKVIRKILLHLAAKGIDARSPPGPREHHPTPA
jgi:hypothetical protein